MRINGRKETVREKLNGSSTRSILRRHHRHPFSAHNGDGPDLLRLRRARRVSDSFSGIADLARNGTY